MGRLIKILLFSLLLMIPVASVVCAAPNIQIISAGSGSYTLQCVNLENAASIQFNVIYDKSVLTPPEPGTGVTQGSAFSMMQFNSNTPGMIRISAINASPVSGTVTIATVAFPSVNGKITANSIVTDNLTVSDSSGRPIGIETVVLGGAPSATGTTNPDTSPAGTNQSNQSNQTGSDSTATGGSGTPVYLGTVTSSPTSPESGSSEKITNKAEPEGQSQPETAAAPLESPSAAPVGSSEPERESGSTATAEQHKLKLPEYPGVLSSFRSFHGELTSKAMVDLATAVPPRGFVQKPSIVLSDGKSPVKMIIHFPADVSATPNFALRGAKMVSLKHDGQDWIIEALPKLNAYDVSISVIYNDTVTVVPLTVAPPLDVFIRKGLAMDENGFTQFLKERGTEKSPSFDLDGDGKRTFIDDYIYTLNYVARPAKKLHTSK